jgi:hypothetical protein
VWGGGGFGCERVAFANLPVQGLKRSLFHRVTDDGPVIKFDECMCGGETEGSVLVSFLYIKQLKAVVRAVIPVSRIVDTICEYTYSTPATPSRTKCSVVIVPVLSKQQTSTRPAYGMRNGSVQKMATQECNGKGPWDITALNHQRTILGKCHE